MDTKKIITSWKKQEFAPFYWFEGEETYFIDTLINYAEHEILHAEEAQFNLNIFYGKDANWADVINACRKYPMFSNRQVVLLKEAQLMHDKDLEKLEPYVKEPLPSTIFIVAYKGKNLDKRKSFSKAVAKFGVLVEFKKLYDNQVPAWIESFLTSKDLKINPKAVRLLFEHIGNDLGRIATEIDKLSLNLNGKNFIDEEDIEKYIGISKEYNIFELYAAIAYKNMAKAVRILNYIHSNPKAFPLQAALPALYSNLSRVYVASGGGKSVNELFKGLDGPKQAQAMMGNYKRVEIEKMLLLLHEYNLKSIGIEGGNASQPELLKELVLRMMIN